MEKWVELNEVDVCIGTCEQVDFFAIRRRKKYSLILWERLGEKDEGSFRVDGPISFR